MATLPRVRRLVHLTWATALAALAACSSPPPRPPALALGDTATVRQHVEALIQHEMQAHDVTGLSIALVDGQHVVWAFGAGWADQQAQRRADAQTLYRMGSISKLFTDTAAMQAVAAGRLALDAPITQALPNWRIRSRFGPVPITARQLMTHHAGLPRDLGYGMWSTAPMSLQQRVAALADEDMAYRPGQLFAYANTDITVLGAALEHLNGQPFEALMQDRLLAPLGMRTASFSAAVSPRPEMSRAYRKGRPQAEPALADVPAGGLNASVLDMAQFIKMVFAEGRSGDQPVLPAAAVREMQQVQNADVALDAGFQVGLGWMLSTLGGEPLEGAGPVLHHGGATVHFRSQMVLLPEHQLGVIVAANSTTAGPVVNRVAQRALALALEAKTGIRQPDPAATVPAQPVAWDDAALQALVGDYTTTAGFVRVTRHGAALQAELLGKTFDLIPQAHGELRLRYQLLGLLPISLGELDRLSLSQRTLAGRPVLVARIGQQTLLAGERLPPASTAPALTRYVGTYVPELAPGERGVVDRVHVSLEQGRLLARLSTHEEPDAPVKFVLQPVSDREALVLGTLADAGEVVRLDPTGTEPTFHAAGYRWHRIQP